VKEKNPDRIADPEKYFITSHYPELNPTTYGVLAGTAFAVVYATLGIFGGLIADT
jgi:hypothetical protein